jgi:hypothetical protein
LCIRCALRSAGAAELDVRAAAAPRLLATGGPFPELTVSHAHVVSAIAASVSLCSLTVVGFLMSPSAATQNPQKAEDPPPYTGMVGEWWVAAPGRVQFQLIGAGRETKDGKEAKHPDLWFETPADKDLNTLYENLVLDVIQYAVTKGMPVVVEAKNSSGDDGSIAAKAFDVRRVGVGKS